MDAPPTGATSGTWTAFLAMAFVVVGLTGLFASYAAPLPLQRALAREAALDAAQRAVHGADPQTALEALRPQLAESADALLPLGGDMEARIAAERVAMRARLSAESAAATVRARWIIGVVTLMGIAFGAAVLNASRHR